jgi:hypothetical protein
MEACSLDSQKEATMLGKVFNRCVEKSPMSVLVRGTLERVLGADQRNVWCARTAQKPSTRTVVLSTVSDLRSPVVCRSKPSVRAASRAQDDTVGASLLAVYTTLQGVATPTSAALVRSSATALQPLRTPLDGTRSAWWPGDRVNIVAGTGSEASAHRLPVVREVQAGALPGQARGVSEPPSGVVCAVLPWEDGHAQERSRLGQVLETVQARDVGLQDRTVCPCALLCGLETRGAGCMTRQQEGLPCPVGTSWRTGGRSATGHVAAPRLQVGAAQGHAHRLRRIQGQLAPATRDGDRVLDLLTNLPQSKASATRVARLDRQRGTLETALQHLAASGHSAIHP